MKKALSILCILSLCFSTPLVFAQMPAAGPGVLPLPSGFERIGVVAAMSGKVELTTQGQAGRIAQSGHPVFIGDEVKTDAAGRLQILLLDETVFTIGPDSAIIIDEFVYDPKTQNGKVQASITKGIFRYVSGKIAAKKPSNVKIKLPTATIGIRGTIVAGQVLPVTSFAMLLGPGMNNDIGAGAGSFAMEGEGANAGQERHVTQTGFGVEVDQSGMLSNVFKVPDAQVNGLTSGLAPDQGAGQGGGGEDSGLGGSESVTGLSGEGTVLAGGNADTINTLTTVTQDFVDDANRAAQDQTSGGAVPNGTTTYEELRAASGSGHYADSGTFGGISGAMEAQANIVFGANGSIGGGYTEVKVWDSSHVNYDTTGVDIGDLSSTSFSGSGAAQFTWTNVSGDNLGVFNNITVTLTNSNGQTAQTATVTVDFSQGSSSVSSGTGSATGTLSSGTLSGPIA